MKKFLNKKNKIKKIIIFLFLILIYTFICAYNYVQAISNNISENVFRLHVIANSNTQEDQSLKYLVRDNLLSYMNSICTNIKSKEEAIKLVNENIDTFKEIALETIRSNGYSYDVKIKIGSFDFPTKNYGDISLPAGVYDALKVEIGEAKGQNWWCVLFPSLCFIDVSSGIVEENSKKTLEDNLSKESYLVISNTDNSNNFHFKFKLLEFFGTNNLFTAKK